MIPLLPMWPFYIGVTLRELQFDHKWEVCSAITVCITIAFLIRYMGIDTAPIREGLGDASFARSCEFIRNSTPKNSVLIFNKPRLLALVTERSASGYDTPDDGWKLWEYFTSISAHYVLVNRHFSDDRDYLEPLILRNALHAREIFTQAQYHLYEII
jgi:hypothetical protein